MTIYIVCGILRSGTSMMMAALEAGGLEAVAKPEQASRAMVDGRDPHPSGVYQLKAADLKALQTADGAAHLDGKLVKVLHRQLATVAHQKHGIRVVFVRRDAEESAQSAMAMFGPAPGSFVAENKRLDEIIADFAARPDVLSVDTVAFREVVADPKACFAALAEHGWPIDVKRAAMVPNDDHVHFKAEDAKGQNYA